MRPGASARRERQERARLRRKQAPGEPGRADPGVPASPREALALAKRLGWTAKATTDGWLLMHPGGAATAIHKTISDQKAWLNIRAELLRPEREKT